MSRVLIVDDEPLVARLLASLVEPLGVETIATDDSLEALDHALHSQIDLVIADQRMNGLTGTELLKNIRREKPDLPAVLMSGYADFGEIIDAFNDDIVDHFIAKPWDNKILVKQIEHLLGTHPADKCNDVATANPGAVDFGLTNFHGLLSNSASMSQYFIKLKKAARANAPIFIHGETGTGKEMSAKAIHAESHRSAYPFVSFNCANFTDSLMESQLFGHRKGAFTGAVKDQEGLFAHAKGGTLFLDEVTAMDLNVQAKLLRVLQEREFSAVGSYDLQPFAGQVVSAASQNLRDAVAAGQFREDLMYRLDVIGVSLPPLRARRQDIVALFQHFLVSDGLSPDTPLSAELTQKLIEYPWPGNVRQLQNAAAYVAAMAEGPTLTIEDLPDEIRYANHHPSPPAQTNTKKDRTTPHPDDIDESMVREALIKYKNRKTRVAESLGISRTTLWRLIRRFNLETP